MTPQELVTEIFHIQEGVILDDLYPSDDKFREIIMWCNKVIKEFTNIENWSFLRKTIVLGPTCPDKHHPNKIPKFMLPEYIDRVCMLNGDALKLHAYYHGCPCCCEHPHINENIYMIVPYASKGNETKRHLLERKKILLARVYDRYIEFNRMPIGHEAHRVALCDCQIKPQLIHVCNDSCIGKDKTKPIEWDKSSQDYNPCSQYQESILEEFPNKDYLIWKTAYYSSLHSPIAQAAKMEIDNTCKTMLSAMRKNDADKTYPDIIEPAKLFIPYQVV